MTLLTAVEVSMAQQIERIRRGVLPLEDKVRAEMAIRAEQAGTALPFELDMQNRAYAAVEFALTPPEPVTARAVRAERMARHAAIRVGVSRRECREIAASLAAEYRGRPPLLRGERLARQRDQAR